MLFITIIALIVAKALPVLNTKINSSHFSRITTISLIFSGLISLNCLNLDSIGSGIGIYSGLFHITQISQIFEIFIFIIGGFILMGWYKPSIANHSTPLSLSYESKDFIDYKLSNYSQPLLEGKNINKTSLPPMANIKNQSDYSLIVLFSILGSSLLISSFDLISIYLSIELQSFGLYVLSTLYKDSESSTSSGLKYFLLGGLSSCIILLGIGLIYSYTGLTNLESLYLLNNVSIPLNGPDFFVSPGNLQDEVFKPSAIGESLGSMLEGLSLGLILIFVGFLFKIAASPLHNWSPDVYDGTPTIVTSWLTIIPKISILILLLELQIQIGSADALIGGIKTLIITNTGYLLDPLAGNMVTLPYLSGAISSNGPASILANLFFVVEGDIPVIKTLLLISSLLSLIIGSLLGLAQIRIKRLLAYSTISHIGFILLALAINTEQSIDSFLFYIIQYTITNLNIFLIILAFTYFISKPSAGNNQSNHRFVLTDIRYISEFKGLFFSNPFLSLSLAVSLFSMAGIPPLIGFFSKQFVLYSALQNGYYFISFIAIIVSVISASYYLKIVKVLLLPTQNENDQTLSAEEHSDHIVEASSPTQMRVYSPQPSKLMQSPSPFAPYFYKNNAKKSPGADKLGEESAVELSNVHSYLISSLTLTILFFFIKPSIILNSSKLLTLSLFSI